MPADNLLYDPTFSCVRTVRGPSDTYCSPCNWANYRNGSDGLPADMSGLMGYIINSFSGQIDKVVTATKDFGWLVKPFVGFAFAMLSIIYIARAVVVQVASTMWPVPNGCDTDAHRNATIQSSIIGGLVGDFIGSPDSLKAALKRRIAYTCPTEIIGPGDLNAARLRGFVNEDQWKFGQELNGQCVDWQERAYLTGQTVFTIPETMRLWCAKVIKTDHLPNWFRANGVINQRIVDGYKYLYEVTPTLSDCMFALAHNTEDDATNELFGLSSDLRERRTPKIDLWLRKAGYTGEMIEFLWRQQRQPVSYRMIGTLYANGQVKREELMTAFLAMGFTRKVSGWMRDMVISQSRAKVAALAGKPTIAELERWYIGGVIDLGEYRNALLDQEVPAESVGNIVNRSDTRKREVTVKVATAWVRPKVIHGLMDEDDATRLLTEAGMKTEDVSKVVDGWKTQKYYGDKAFSLSELCKLVASGHMDMPEYMERAKRLGWNELDAALQAQTCNENIQETRRKLLDKAQSRALKEAKAATNERSKAAKELLKRYREEFPCRPRPKPQCPPGVDLPKSIKELGNV